LDADIENELIKAQERNTELEVVVSQYKCDNERLERAADQVPHLEGRVRELVDRENQLNAELEHARSADHRRTLEQNQQVLVLRAEVDAMRRTEAGLRDSLNELTERCDRQLSQAKADHMEAVNHLTSLLQDNQSQLLAVVTDLDAARQQLEITARKLDERSTQLEDAVEQLKMAEDSMVEMRRSSSELEMEAGKLQSERDLLSERLSVYEESSVVNGADGLVRQTSDLEKRIVDRDGTIIQLESVVRDLKQLVKNTECREEALAAENVRLRQELDSTATEQLRTTAGLQGKVHLFEQVVGHKDREISTLRSELSLAREAPGRSGSSSFGKIVAASAETDAGRRLSRLEDIFREMNATHADQVSSMTRQLEQASDDLQLFKEHAKKQFENQQEKVSFVDLTTQLMVNVRKGIWPAVLE